MKSFTGLAVVMLLATPALAGSDKQPPGQRTDNFGEVTSRAITENDWDQGDHARDPTGDGFGRSGGNDEPRSGLPNATGSKGDLSATMDALGLGDP